MQKIFLLFLMILTELFLVGCTAESTKIVLSESTGQETAGEVSGEPEIPEAGTEASDAGSSFAREDAVAESAPKGIYVYVCGAVADPGVYELMDGSRAADAVEAAGGFLEDADRNYVNLAAPLNDGVKLLIPTLEETAGSARAGIDDFDSGDGQGDGRSLININRASRQELTALPGIGESTADKIVRYRDEHGDFKSIEEIMNVSGIKDKLFSRIKEYITV